MSTTSNRNRQDHPKVSVVLATYQRQSVLPRAIQSVVSQSMDDWELLIVDDEPSEETATIVSSFGDPRIRYLRHDQNRGLCAARNTGIREARGQYIAFLDDDDVYFENKLERQSAMLDGAHDEVGVVSCFEAIIHSDGSSRDRALTLDGDVHPALLRDDLVRMQLLLVRRVCFDRVGLFDERLEMHDDFDMTLRLSRGFHFVTVPEPLVGIIGTPGSMSTQVEKRVHALEIMMSSHPEFREHRRVRARWERRLARHHAELHDREQW
jgi:glycosyltransferase involved in cell wall biosynthesis